MRKCFTINCMRSKEDIRQMEEKLVKTKIYSGCELFYPYNVSDEQKNIYEDSVISLIKYQNFEFVLHLPHGSENNVASYQNLNVVMDRMKQAIDFASKFGVKKLTLHPGQEDGELSREEAILLSIQNIQKLCDYAKKYNMMIMIENLVGKRELCLTIDEIKYHLQNINRDNCHFILDCGHYNVANNHKDLHDVVYLLKDELVHLHLSNNNAINDQHSSLKNGNIDMSSYFKYLKEINYQGLYCSEVLFKTIDELIVTASLMDELGGN